MCLSPQLAFVSFFIFLLIPGQFQYSDKQFLGLISECRKQNTNQHFCFARFCLVCQGPLFAWHTRADSVCELCVLMCSWYIQVATFYYVVSLHWLWAEEIHWARKWQLWLFEHNSSLCIEMLCTSFNTRGAHSSDRSSAALVMGAALLIN